jgi:hypothetical protein
MAKAFSCVAQTLTSKIGIKATALGSLRGSKNLHALFSVLRSEFLNGIRLDMSTVCLVAPAVAAAIVPLLGYCRCPSSANIKFISIKFALLRICLYLVGGLLL